jgi:hypothetical protein
LVSFCSKKFFAIVRAVAPVSVASAPASSTFAPAPKGKEDFVAVPRSAVTTVAAVPVPAAAPVPAGAAKVSDQFDFCFLFLFFCFKNFLLKGCCSCCY